MHFCMTAFLSGPDLKRHIFMHFCIVAFFSDPHFQRRLFRIFALLHFSQVHIFNDFFLHCCIFCRTIFSTTPFLYCYIFNDVFYALLLCCIFCRSKFSMTTLFCNFAFCQCFESSISPKIIKFFGSTTLS